MKRIILLVGVLVSLATAQIVFGQSEGIISYEVKMNMHRNIPKEREGMKNMIPEYRTTKQQLFFNNTESFYKTVVEDEEEASFSGTAPGGGGMRMVFRMPNIEMYFNQETGRIVSKQEFMGKNYLITDSVKMSPWKFGTETRTIANYECKMAYFTRTDTIRVMNGPDNPEKRVRTSEITAWYTDKIKPFLGPERYNTLPGTVLAIDINNGERVFVATAVELRSLKKNELKEPTSGTKVTQEEFQKLMQEQMKQMGGGPGRVIIGN